MTLDGGDVCIQRNPMHAARRTGGMADAVVNTGLRPSLPAAVGDDGAGAVVNAELRPPPPASEGGDGADAVVNAELRPPSPTSEGGDGADAVVNAGSQPSPPAASTRNGWRRAVIDNKDDGEQLGRGDVAPPDGIAAPGSLGERPQQAALGTSLRVVMALVRLRRRVRHGHKLLAKRAGKGLMMLSVGHSMALVVVAVRGGGVLSTQMTRSASVASFMIHLGFALPYSDTSYSNVLWTHYGMVTLDAAIRGVSSIQAFDFSSAAERLVWLAFLYPLGAWGLRRFLRAVRTLDATTLDAVSRNAIVAFTGCAVPILYFLFNGLLCLGFASDPGYECATRVQVNSSAILLLLANAAMMALHVLQPVTLEAITHLSIPIVQVIGFGFAGILFLLTVALHSQNERFGPATPAIEHMHSATYPAFMLSSVTFAISIATATRKPTRRNGQHQQPSQSTRYGDLLPFRALMVTFTIIFLIITVSPFEKRMRAPFTMMSISAACFHVWVSIEHESARPAVIHFFAHASSSVVIGVRMWKDGEGLGTVLFYYIAYLGIFYPACLKVLLSFRDAVREHGPAAAAQCTAVAFSTFWFAIVPTLLFLGADSLGCLLRRPFDVIWQEEICRSRTLANFVGSLQVVFSSSSWMVLTNTEGGAGFDMITAMYVAFSTSELVSSAFATIASLIALYLFANRDEPDKTDTPFFRAVLSTTMPFTACWVMAVSILAFTMKPVSVERNFKRELEHDTIIRGVRPRHRRNSSGPATLGASAGVVIYPPPRAWCFVMMSLSFMSYTVPQMVRMCLRTEYLRGASAGFSYLCWVSNALLSSTDASSSAQRRIFVHFVTGVLAGRVASFVSDSRSVGWTLGGIAAFTSSQVGYVCLIYVWMHINRMLAKKNPQLHGNLPRVTFIWIFKRGGFGMAVGSPC